MFVSGLRKREGNGIDTSGCLWKFWWVSVFELSGSGVGINRGMIGFNVSTQVWVNGSKQIDWSCTR